MDRKPPTSISGGSSLKDINLKVKTQLSNYQNTNFIDLYDELIENNNLSEKYTYDGLHLNMAGYEKVSKLLNKYL